MVLAGNDGKILGVIEEVARAEASLARHALILRRLVLRYGKALLITIWTTIVTATVSAVIITEFR